MRIIYLSAVTRSLVLNLQSFISNYTNKTASIGAVKMFYEIKITIPNLQVRYCWFPLNVFANKLLHDYANKTIKSWENFQTMFVDCEGDTEENKEIFLFLGE